MGKQVPLIVIGGGSRSLDDMENPILTAKEKNLTHGLVGIGSFDDTGYFDDICLKGKIFSQ